MSTPDNGWWDKHYASLGPRQRLRLWRDNLPDFPQHTIDNLLTLKRKGDLNKSDQDLLNTYLKKHQTHQGLPTLTVQGPTKMASGEEAVFTFTLSDVSDQLVSGDMVVTGQQDGDLDTPSDQPFTILAGQPSVNVAVKAALVTRDADVNLSLAFTNLVGLAKPLPVARTLVLTKSVVTSAKGFLTFPEPIGTVVRDAANVTTVLVKVERQHVSTHEAATMPVVDVVLPPEVLKVVGPAEFKAGSKYGWAPMELHPYGAAARPTTVKTTPGKASLVATPDFDLGAVASQDFTVQDGSVVVVPPSDAWWKIPGGNLSGNAWNIGWNSTGWTPAKLGAYQAATGRRPDVVCAANHPGAAIRNDWAEFQAQAFINTVRSGFGSLIGVGVKGKTIHLLNFYSWPVNMPLSELAVAGPHDAEYVKFGQNLRAEWGKTGMEDWQIALRFNKEENQNKYIVSASQGPLYKAASARCVKGVRQGYGMTSRGRLRFSFSPSRQAVVGPLKGFFAVDDDGSSLFDVASVSHHHGPQLNTEKDKPATERLAAAVAWIHGGFKEGYSYLNDDPTLSIKALTDEFNIGVSLDEWGPNFTAKGWCALAPEAIQATYDMCVGLGSRLAWDCVYNVNILSETAVSPVWPETSRLYKKLWHA